MSNINKIIEKLDKLSVGLQAKTNLQEGSSGQEILTTLVKAQEQLRIFHWQTKSYAQHKTFGEIYEKLSESIDELLETYFGKYGRVSASGTFDFSLENLSDANGVAFIDSFIGFLVNRFPSLVDAKDTDLLNIRDEILGSLNQTKYLLTLS